MRIVVDVAFTTTNITLDDLADDMQGGDLLALLELETNVPLANMDLYVDDKMIEISEMKSKALKDLNIRNNSHLSIFSSTISETDMAPRPLAELQTLRTQLRSDPYQFSIIRQACSES